MEGIFFLFVAIITITVFFAWRDKVEKKKREEMARKYAISQLAERTQAAIDKLDRLKTNTAKANSCGIALGYLKQAAQYSECRSVILNYDELVKRLASIQKVLPVIDHVEKATKHQFKGKKSSELNSLQDALYEIRTKGITNEDFGTAQIFPEGTGEIVSIESIEERCKELGWEPA